MLCRRTPLLCWVPSVRSCAGSITRVSFSPQAVGRRNLMELTGLKSYPAGLTMTAARRVTDRFCQCAIELVLDTDVAMKTSAGEQEQLLELLLVRLAQEAQHG